MRTLTFAVAIAVATASHAGPLDEYLQMLGGDAVSGIHDRTVLIASSPWGYDPHSSWCWRLLRKLIHAHNRMATLKVYAACPQDDPARDRIRSLQELAWPYHPGRH